MEQLMVGRSVLQYRFIEKLGAGGMGEIYKAQDTRLNRFVAIKVLPSSRSGDPERRKRFIQEAQAASSLNHPSIITIHDIISEGDTEFMVMEFVAGKTLNDLIPKGGLRVPQALTYSLQMADALSAAHGAGIVHRDLKPANVMITDSGLVKILDFGLAKLTDRTTTQLAETEETISTAEPLTIEGSILGTVNYMSPEQAQGRKVDARSDIFSFGVVLYEMLTGVRAFQGETSLSTLSAILRDEAKPMIEVAPDVPPQLESVIYRCLRKNPDDRCQTMKEVQAALSVLKRESDSGSLYTSRIAMSRPIEEVGSKGPKSVAPSRVASAPVSDASKPASPKSALIVAAVAILFVGIGGGTWFYMRSKAEQRAAQLAAQTPPPAPVQQAAPEPPPLPPPVSADGTLRNDDVLEMVKENLPTPLVLSQIRASKTDFNLSTSEVIRLSKAGVPVGIIEAMRNPKAVPPQNVPSPKPATTNVKQASTPVPANPLPTVTASAPTPAAVPIATAPAQPLNIVTPEPKPAPQNIAVSLADGVPFRIALATDIPADAEVGHPLKFVALDEFKAQGVVVIAKGATVYGEISQTATKKMFGIGGAKLSFRLTKADGAGGQAIAVRAMAAKRQDGVTQRQVEVAGSKSTKDVAAPQGTEYIAYIDGAQTVSVPQK